MIVTLFENVSNTSPMEYVDFSELMRRMTTDASKRFAAEMSSLYKSDKDKYDAMKKRSLPAFAIGRFSARNSNSCTAVEHYMGLDIDHVPEGKMREVFEKIAAWEYCWCVFPSVSENGFRVIVPVEYDLSTRVPMYESLVQMFSAYSGISIDSELPPAERKSAFCINASTKDVCRLWFYTGMREFRYNPNAKKLMQPKVLSPVIAPTSVRTLQESDRLMVAIITSEAERRRIDLTVGYQAWFDVGMSLASLGEDGRVPFHRLSAISSQYKESVADKKFSEWVKNASGRKTVRTLAKMAKDAGIMYSDSPLWREMPEESRVASKKLQEAAPEDAQVGDATEYESMSSRLSSVSFKYGQKPKDIDFVLKANVDGKLFDIGGFGMIGLITGLEKSRKTTLLRAITSSALSNGAKKINFQMDLRGKKAIYIDTEQPEYFFWNGQMQAHRMAGLGDAVDSYEAYSLRGFSVEDRIAAVEHLIGVNDNLGLLILDGVLDFVKNFNSEEQSQAMVQRIMEWTDRSGAMVLAVIHVGKSSGMTTGHLGSMLNKKCDFSFEMKNDPDTGYTTVNSRLSRTKPFTSFDFTQDENGQPVLANHLQRKSEEGGSYEEQVVFDFPTTQPPVTPSKRDDDDQIPF